MTKYVLVHGAWHSGELLSPVAEYVRAARKETHVPTLAGNRAGETKDVGLEDAITSVTDYLEENDLTGVVLAGHSYGGMVITGVADRVPERIRRLVYWNAFVPNAGESLIDMVPEVFGGMFAQLAEGSGDNTITLPFPIWREVFFNEGDLPAAQAAYERLNPQPYRTFADKIELSKNPAEMEIPKSYINGLNDAALPHSLGWHPRLSEKLGLFRLVQMMGGHETCFTDPKGTAEAILMAGRD
ncbi:alpha/beta hydrolase [Sulfitobacter sp. D35]|uniref:alpha/beta fold hydrolase n=1 Tax=Sulfitobacter sp. D35 TaxID=3083252 RepID=UPI00296FBD72|nr:alpha/beta hydrolase [Sulfitobacter sp. D35]MDW4497845.1 alpha/beta hydrolase [Sulfitobacter sp. D35]